MVPFPFGVHPAPGPRSGSDSAGAPFRWASALILLAAACAPAGEVPEGGESPAPAAAAAPLPPLDAPRSWQGELPCADCAAIRTTLTLEPEGAYHRTDAYRGKAPASDTVFAGIGHWTLSDGRTRIELRGTGDGPDHLAVLEGGDLQVLDRSGNPIDSQLEDRLRPLPNPVDPSGRLQLLGAFTYLADAALLVECTSGLQFPVAMEGGYLPLERTYTGASISPGTPLVVRIQGTLERRPAMEGEGIERMVVVESHEVPSGEGECGVLRLREALAAGDWVLEELDGGALQTTPGEAPTLSWDPAASQVAGSSGCNRYTGRAFLRGSRLVVETLAGTRRFCEGAMELESRVLEVIEAGGWLSLDGPELVLFRGPDPVARFARAGGG